MYCTLEKVRQNVTFAVADVIGGISHSVSRKFDVT